MTNRRLLGFVFLGLGIPVAMVFQAMLAWIWRLLDIAMTVGGIPILWPIALVLTAAVGFGVWNHARSYSFSEEVLIELRKVVWPRMQEVQDSTIVVIATTIVVALMLGGFDLVWAKISNLILYR